MVKRSCRVGSTRSQRVTTEQCARETDVQLSSGRELRCASLVCGVPFRRETNVALVLIVFYRKDQALSCGSFSDGSSRTRGWSRCALLGATDSDRGKHKRCDFCRQTLQHLAAGDVWRHC